MSALPTESYLEQVARWPKRGRRILAHGDDASVVVYQAYRPSIARYALEHESFGGSEFSFRRMSWIKPNFLWMMYRSAWGTAEGQEMVLAIRLSRAFFERVLRAAVPSTHAKDGSESRAEWQARVASSDVRLQWDPDHDPTGTKLERRAIQLGLRGDTLRAFATTEILELIDMTPFVAEQRANARRERWPELRIPVERVYEPSDRAVVSIVGLDER